MKFALGWLVERLVGLFYFAHLIGIPIIIIIQAAKQSTGWGLRDMSKELGKMKNDILLRWNVDVLKGRPERIHAYDCERGSTTLTMVISVR